MYTSRGIKNHEKHCNENPYPGVHPSDAPELFDEEQGDAPGGADPDQRAVHDGGSLPARQSLPDEVKNSGDGSDQDTTECPACSSSDTIPAHEARSGFQREMNPAPQDLLATLDAVERYCNECYSVYGGELSEPFDITEGLA